MNGANSALVYLVHPSCGAFGTPYCCGSFLSLPSRYLPSPPLAPDLPRLVSFNLSPPTGRRDHPCLSRRSSPQAKQHNACNATFRTRGRPKVVGHARWPFSASGWSFVAVLSVEPHLHPATRHEQLEFERLARTRVRTNSKSVLINN